MGSSLLENGDRDREAPRGLIEATQDAVVFIDEKAMIVRFNPSAVRIFGYQESEALGMKVNRLMPPPYANEHDEYIAHYERTGEPQAIGRIRAVEALRKNGEVFPIELSVTEVPIRDGVRYCALIRDVSEKVRLQAQVSEKGRLAAIGTTAAALAHEVGNPLNNMRLQSQLALRRMKQCGIQDEGMTQSLRSISDEVARLSELLEEFRLLSRRQSLRLGDTDVSDLVQQLCDEHQSDFQKSEVVVERNVEPALPTLRADASKLRQVLLNLFKNAVEAMPAGGTLGVSVTSNADDIMVEVADSGIGVPEGLEVFEPFQTTKEGGTGLGLPIAQRIVSAHGGRISWRPRPEGGTVFRVELPIAGPSSDSTPPGPL